MEISGAIEIILWPVSGTVFKLVGDMMTYQVATDAHFTLNGVPCNPRDLRAGDYVTLSGSPILNRVDATRS